MRGGGVCTVGGRTGPEKESPMAISAMIITSLAITNRHLRKTSNTRALLRKSATEQVKGVPLAISARIITPLATNNKHCYIPRISLN